MFSIIIKFSISDDLIIAKAKYISTLITCTYFSSKVFDLSLKSLVLPIITKAKVFEILRIFGTNLGNRLYHKNGRNVPGTSSNVAAFLPPFFLKGGAFFGGALSKKFMVPLQRAKDFYDQRFISASIF